MKRNHILFTLIFCFISSNIIAQIINLAKIAEGKIVYTSTLFDSKKQLFGYLYIYENDKEDKEHKSLEYVLLDKNLNRVSNKEFSDKIYKHVYSKYYDCTLMGDNIILNKYYYYYSSFQQTYNPLLTTYQIISLKNNTVSGEFKYADGKFTEFVADFDDMKTQYKGNETKSIIYSFNLKDLKGFYVEDRNIDKSYAEKELKFFNEEKQNIWSYEYNPNPSRSKYSTYSFLHTHDNNLYLGISKIKLKPFSTTDPYKKIEYKIVAVDLLTGKTKFEYILDKLNADTIHFTELKQINKNLIITGLYAEKNNINPFTFVSRYLGAYRIILNEEGKVVEKKYYDWSKFSDKIKITDKGCIEGGFYLQPLSYYVFKDGSVSILTEEQKNKVIGGGFFYKNYVLFTFDKEFNIKNIHEIERNTTEGDDGFLFSQYINDESNVLFFNNKIEINAETKKKEYFLFINKIINGDYTFEKIPLTINKKNSILPFPAKEGYIMLQEYNEDEKFYQIRLERLNY